MRVRKLNWNDLGIGDNNDGYIYGIEETELIPPDYVEWFKSEEERDKYIKENNFEVEE